jgi:methionyl-tRNA synthetase
VLYHLVETLRLVALQLTPFMPVKAGAMLSQLMSTDINSSELMFHDLGGWGYLKPGHQCSKPEPVFPRMD